ncbi:MAG: hypothetical protein GXP62_01860 [Oligoflexia bacterium]|nr:hypothetical protein [Oligoflexia bacterium]
MKRVTITLLALLLPAAAHAQSRRLVFEETRIIGKVQKPEITIFITRQNLNTDYNLELRESFIPKIVKSVEKSPF